jgi:hypothetical protein
VELEENAQVVLVDLVVEDDETAVERNVETVVEVDELVERTHWK